MRVSKFGSIIAVAALVAACSSSETPAIYPERASSEAKEEPKPPAGALWREVVDATVDQGLGYFLQRVDVAPSFDKQGRFEGFRIVELRGGAFWDGVDLRAGDVVLRVNGKPIEREGQAYEVFQELKSAEKLEVHYLRQGQRRNLTYKIIPRGKSVGSPQPASAAPKQAEPAAPAKPAPASSHS